MVDEQTWRACMDSEIFREYLSDELRKEAEWKAEEPERIAQAMEKETVAQHAALAAFDELEAAIRKSPRMLEKFKQVKAALINNPQLIEKTDPAFVDGIMMLDLDD